ncbi:MAG: hypothetical protein QHJ73_01360, partial [Armatimonadota bacterium]|nr:hypothetical protein [Armatimonadota bacterium]
MPPSLSIPDPYRPLAAHLALGERLEELAMARVRRGVVGWLRERGFARVLDVACGTGAFARLLA